MTLQFGIAVRAQSGQLIFRHINRSNGLPADQVTAMAQDSSGFIWIGTTEGLFRYDGFSFKSFFAIPGNAQTLPENIITKIFVSRSGLLWVGTVGGGITCMKKDGRVIKTFNAGNTACITPFANHVSNIAEDKQGTIWWTSVDGLFELQAGAASPKCYKIKSSGPRDNLFNDFCFDAKGTIWLAGFLGFYTFSPQTKIFSPVKKLADKKDVARLLLHQNRLWYSAWNPDLGVYDTLSQKHTLLYSGLGAAQPQYERMSNAFYADKKNNLWIATSKGLLLVNQNETKLAQSFLHEPGNPFSLVYNDVQCILEDREGNFWFGTRQGISMTQPYAQAAVNYAANSLNKAPFGDKYIKHIIEVDSSTFLVATHHADGIYETDSNFKVRQHFSFGDVKYDWIWAWYDDVPRNRLIFSTQEGMLAYDKSTHRLSKAMPSFLHQRNTISSMVATSDSILWMSRFRNQVIRYHLRTGAYKTYSLEQLGLPSQVVYLSKDRNNQIWFIGHQSGLMRFDAVKEKIAEQLTVNQSHQSLRQANVNFFKDLGRYFIIGYHTKGISLYDKVTRQYQHYTQADGLASNNTQAVFAAGENEVWIATSNGISRFDLQNKSIKTYGYENGFISNAFVCITQLSSGKIAAGSTQGLVVFHPAQIDQATQLPPPIITEVNVYGKKLVADEVNQQPMQISYRENYFSIDYLCLLYSNYADVEYAYKLEGLDKDWVPAGTRRFASYAHVKGGSYTFKVRARRPGGTWVESIAPFPLTVSTPFYTRWWFFVAVLLGIAATIFVLFRYRVHQVLKLERMRTTISSDLHDEVGASLTSISIFSEMARKSAAPSSKEEQYLQRIGDRSRESIEKMSDIIWSINPDNDSLQQMLVRMKNYAMEISEAGDILVHWSEPARLNASRLSMEQRKNMYLLYKEAINNSVKHASAANVWVDLTATSNSIVLTIKDDGNGFDRQSSTTGNGIKNMHRRAAFLKGVLQLNSSPGNGTSVQLQFYY